MRGVNLLIRVGVLGSTDPVVTVTPGPVAGEPDLITAVTGEPTLQLIATGRTFTLDPAKTSERLFFFAQPENGIVNESQQQPTGSLTISQVFDDATGRYDPGLAILRNAGQKLNQKVWMRAERFLRTVGTQHIYDVQMGAFIVGYRTDQNAQAGTIDDNFTFQGTGELYQGYLYK
jgi:hypothetical protein